MVPPLTGGPRCSSIKTLQMAFPERAADGLHEARESGRES